MDFDPAVGSHSIPDVAKPSRCIYWVPTAGQHPSPDLYHIPPLLYSLKSPLIMIQVALPRWTMKLQTVELCLAHLTAISSLDDVWHSTLH